MTSVNQGTEHNNRRQYRLEGPFPVIVRGKNASGQVFKTHTLADNISIGGLYLQLPGVLVPGLCLFAYTVLPSGARLAARGRVLRVEPKPLDLLGIALAFSCTKLFASAA